MAQPSQTTTQAKEEKLWCFGKKWKKFIKCCWFVRYFFLILSIASQFSGFYCVWDGFLFEKLLKNNKKERTGVDVLCSLGAVAILDGFGFWLYLKIFYCLQKMKTKKKNRFQRYFPTCLKKFLRFVTMVALPLYSATSGLAFHKLRATAFASGFFALSSVFFCLAMLNIDDCGIADCFAACVLSMQISMHTKLLYLVLPAVSVVPAIRILLLPFMKFVKKWANDELEEEEEIKVEQLPIFFQRFACLFGYCIEPEDLEKLKEKKKEKKGEEKFLNHFQCCSCCRETEEDKKKEEEEEKKEERGDEESGIREHD